MNHAIGPGKLCVALALCLSLLTPSLSFSQTTLRIGHFPNITHVQALVAHHLSRQGKGWFEERLGPDVKIEWYVYNAGPSAVEAIFAKSIDLTYVGPNPAINAYVRSRGQEIRIVAGSVQTETDRCVWTVEPWVSRLELEAEGEVLVEDREAITTVLVVRADLLASQQGLVRKFVDAHRELTDWIVKNPAEAQRMAREELDEEMRTKFAPELIAKAWDRIVVTGDVTLDSLKKFVASAQSVGFLRGAPDISSLVVSP